MIPVTNAVFNDNPGTVEDKCTSDYILHEGVRVIPVMGPVGTPPVKVRMHAPYTMRNSNFSYVRSKTPPAVPMPADTPSGHTYLGGHIEVPAPSVDSQASIIYTVKGSYSFVLPADLREGGKIMFDRHSHRSIVDFLGYFYLNTDPKVDDTWNFPSLDLNYLASSRILG